MEAGCLPMKALDQTLGQHLVRVARQSIEDFLQTQRRWTPTHDGVDERLLQHQACFVTLQRDGQLRGCIGCLEPREPLIDSVAHNAWSAAFSDPRFPAVTRLEAPELQIDISVLGLPTPIAFNNEAELLAALRPGIDGLILQAPQGGRATFLPSVWEQLPDPSAFLQHLKVKAGLDANYWHPQLRAERYEVQYFEENH